MGPDGMAISSSSHLWVALPGSGSIGCYSPKTGKEVTKVGQIFQILRIEGFKGHPTHWCTRNPKAVSISYFGMFVHFEVQNVYNGVWSAQVDLPIKNPTCTTFGGKNLDQLYVTSMKEEGDEASENWGGVFRIQGTGESGYAPAYKVKIPDAWDLSAGLSRSVIHLPDQRLFRRFKL